MRIHFTLNNTEGDYVMIPVNRGIKRYYQTKDGMKIIRKEVILQTPEHANTELVKHPNIADLLTDGDLDVDIELVGKFIPRKNRVYVSKDYKPVYNYEMIDILAKPDGSIIERTHKTRQANVFVETPLILKDQYEQPNILALKYVFTKNYYIRHYNGVTFEFLYNLAKNLYEDGMFQQVQAYDPDTKRPCPILVTAGGSLYARAYLEGRIQGNSYCLILHLSDRELKTPDGGA